MNKYCESIFKTVRRKTREVMVGNVGVGGDNPIRIQSMTTSNTRDVEATIDQIMRLADAGCEIARVTVQGMKEADACEGIKNGLLQRGYTIPVVADIHFYPPAATRVVDFVDKVRVNPGNFVDKRASFKMIDYDDLSYAKELEKIEEKFSPLVEKCKRLKRAMRIGTNHGSLSDRIMNRYGDSPIGMVESALEFANVCRKYDYHDFIFSMKSSNPQVMILAYRLLVAKMMDLGWDYPLHLGVTEAGEGEDGRIKSAMGIGSLLLDGIGNTIRVSLTEDPWNEIDPCQKLAAFAKAYEGTGIASFVESHRHFEEIKPRSVILPKNMALHRDGSVIIKATPQDLHSSDVYKKLGCDAQLGRPKLRISSADCIVMNENPRDQKSIHVLNELKEIGVGLFFGDQSSENYHLMTLQESLKAHNSTSRMKKFMISTATTAPTAVIIKKETPDQWSDLEKIKPSVIFLSPPTNRL
ncbi:MAG: (E)-4-hydroxy-3-methylbut-2-enyl-diphosphate synthase, partial [Parachlamydiaceae bacterium]|nr:(E)-4-hydroxy-3-methylbut-2-enyl-diphosphate synthase [Parachlamydiaceae bacterium]